jgi:hypothetical protein
LLRVLNQAFDQPMPQEECAANPVAGGIASHGYQCGMVWGATLAAGAQAYRTFGAGPQAQTRAIMAAQGIVESFRAQNNNVNCLEITELDLSSPALKMITHFLIKGGAVGCFRMAAKFPPVAFDEMSAAFSETPVEPPVAPVSCATLLAQEMGASDLHGIMAAGLAGGIGLSGGACGALGAAIWIHGVNILKQGGQVPYQAPHALETIERFIKSSGYEFECSKIAGRKFESIADHAGYLHDGGCSKIIKALAGV